MSVKNRLLASVSLNHRILVIDNFDSFTYNLIHLMEQLDMVVEVCRNDAVKSLELEKFTHLLIGPGPALPNEAGDMVQILEQWPTTKPLLGVCLGMQAMIERSGAALLNLTEVQHGAQSHIEVDGQSRLFTGLPRIIKVGRYHSWGIAKADIPGEYKCTSADEFDIAMAIEHKSKPWFGVQFHPESIMTEYGLEMLRNFVQADQRNSQ